ncbi:hypothetical protein Pst134EA_004888 [Puccinia striiformis f. sp. tritici]|uniref:Uncharacterized protein n=2 Tax=Puccinia striiformis TaxID=27350 RepID=A0A0L0UZZ4_9BASI|nr:hypothetical protein Pst134EA_004888 [Puccinia striiformis f. sp. tritici]KAH9470978.1 hypothetical protein Pst134EA_004888 [Puccinia striiformis f. sp. tritici]KAI9624569.1 hypothetical protein H4Q26_016798 [Puccinia striiformis f. sp. tritici PST-130]KNE92603.1 hypothetical protein PSTG_13989 [Puccinia striiformis f. sp. tritici PST-78]
MATKAKFTSQTFSCGAVVPHTQPRLYRQASNTGISTNSATSIRGGGRVRSSSSPGSSSSTNSPTDYPSPNHPLMPNSRRSRSSTMMPEYPVENSPNQGLSREFGEVIIRFERERDGRGRLLGLGSADSSQK